MQNKKQRTLTIVLIALILAFVGSLSWFLVNRYVDRSGWYEKNGDYYYRDFHWRKVSGWQKIDGYYYYFGDDHIMQTDWLEWEGGRYRLGADGALDFGWMDIEGQRYYAGGDGVLLTDWQVLEENRYFFREDGAMQTGWLELNEKQYHFGENGIQTIGFYTENEDTWFFGDDGVMYTGEHILEGQTYLFQEDGTMYTGWLDTDSGRRHYHADGPMDIGWQTIAGERYYFDDSGIMQTGWFQEGEYHYYFQEDGSAAVGEVTIDDRIYHFAPMGIQVLLVNGEFAIPEDYETELVTINDWRLISAECYDALVKMMDDCIAAGNKCSVSSGYRTYDDQVSILNSRIKDYMEDGLSQRSAEKKALKSVALPGHSEHHLGLAADINGTGSHEWLAEHCWEYGFILRYTAEKEAITGIIDEPWHFRYVGTEVSMDIKDTGLCLEEYLGAA